MCPLELCFFRLKYSTVVLAFHFAVVAPQTLVQVPTEPALRSAESEAEKW